MAEAKAIDDARLEAAGQDVERLQGDPVTPTPPESGTIEVRITSQSGEASEGIEVEPIPETPPILNADSVLSYSEETVVMVGGDPTAPLAPTPTPEQLRDARDKAQRELLAEPLEEFPEEHVIVRPGVLPVDYEPPFRDGIPEHWLPPSGGFDFPPPDLDVPPTDIEPPLRFGNDRPPIADLPQPRLNRGQRIVELIKKLNRKKTVLVGFGAGAAALLALALGGAFGGGGGDNTVASSGGEPAPVNPLVAVQPQQPAQPTATATLTPTLTPEPTATLTPVPAPETAGATGAQDGVPATGSIAAGPAPSSQEQAPVPQEQAPPAPAVQEPAALSEEQVLLPNGTAQVTLDNTVTSIVGNCPLASPSNPGQQIAVGDHVPGQGNWTLSGSGTPLTLASNDGLTGLFNPTTGIFSLQSADGTRSSTGPVSSDGLSLSGTSVYKPNATCTLNLSFTGTFEKPLFFLTTIPVSGGLPPGPTPVTAAGLTDLELAIEEAYEGAFTNAVRTGDETYLLSHDSQVAIDYYGFARCQEHFANVPPDPTFTIVVTGEITGPFVWTWVYQGNVIGENIPEVYSIPAQVTQKGQTVSAVLHASWDGDLVVYSPC